MYFKYMVLLPTDKPTEELEVSYERSRQTIRNYKERGYQYNIVGDINCETGKGRFVNLVEEHGLDDWNNRENMLLEFCHYCEIVISATWFKMPTPRFFDPQHPLTEL